MPTTENKRPRMTAARRAPVPKEGLDGHKKAPQGLKLLVTIVPRHKTDFFMDFIESFDANLQLCFAARGTASSEVLALMGLEDSEKRVILSIIREDKAPAVLAALEEKFRTVRGGQGIAMTVPMTSVIGASIYQFLANNRKGGVVN